MIDRLKEKRLRWNIIKTQMSVISLAVAVIAAVFALAKETYFFAKEHVIDSNVKIDTCEFAQEIHVGEKLNKYVITIEPPYELGRIGVQAYINVSYDGYEQVILLDDLFTRPVYYSEETEDGKNEVNQKKVFTLLKRSLEEQMVSLLEDKIEENLVQNGLDVNLLSIEANTILCVYCDDADLPTYYLFNNGTPEEEDRDKALAKINSDVAVYEINVMFSREKELLKIVDEMVELL